MQPKITLMKQSSFYQTDNSSTTLATGSYMEHPTVDGPSADLKQIDIGRLNDKRILWGDKNHQDSDYTRDECDTFNDR